MKNRPTLRLAVRPRSLSLKVSPAVVALLLLALVAPAKAQSGSGNQFPALGSCQILQVPAGNALLAHAVGVGVQIYSWDGMKWNFVSPEATLFAANWFQAGFEEVIAFHFAGPTWEDLTGSTVIGKTSQSCTPNANAIPWLLLSASSNTGRGPFSKATFIQRLSTVGGTAPATPGTTPGEVVRVPYSADYYFYQKQR